MTDDLTARGLGALPDTPDPRDYPIDALYAAEDVTPVALDALPSSYRVPTPLAPILDQGSTPQCVAYSSSWQKAYADFRDQLAWFDFAEALFFQQIGGTAAGAEVRWAMQRMVDAGYPVTNVANSAAKHKIAAYYRLDPTWDAIRQALATFGVPLVLSTAWFHSWFHPAADGTLPAPDSPAGGHAIIVCGWEGDRLLLANSWGTDWGRSGYCWLPKAYLSHARAAWRAVDVIEHPVPYKHVVKTIARLNLRAHPRTTAAKLGLIPAGAEVHTLQIEKYGGKYTVDGKARTDWYQVNRSGRVGWIARGYTRLVK